MPIAMESSRRQERILVGPTRLTLAQRVAPRRVAAAMVRDVRELHHFRFVLRNLVVNQLTIRYQRSFLGFFWTLLNPILMMTVLAIVFSNIWRIPATQFAVYIFAGMVPWQFFSSTVVNGSRCLITAEYLIHKIHVQKMVFPLAETLVGLVNMCFAILALGLLLQVLHAGVGVQLVLLPAGIALLTLFTYGMTLVAMTLVTRWRDFEHIIGVILQAGYFFTPILYMPKDVGPLQSYLSLNPLTHILAIFQYALYYGPQQNLWPSMENWLIASISALAAAILGYGTYKVYEYDYVFFL